MIFTKSGLHRACLGLLLGGLLCIANLAQAAVVGADAPEIQYYGRWLKDGETARCGYGATYIKAVFEGTSIIADLQDEHSLWQVSVDDGAFQQVIPAGERTILAKHLPFGKHSITLLRQNEGEYGVSQFKGFMIPGGSILPGTKILPHRIEFVGDSITAGFRNLLSKDAGQQLDMPQKALEDGNQAYGPVLARMLQADFSVIAKSGQGVVQNYREAADGQSVHCIDSYGWACFSNELQAEHIPWQSSDFPVDAIIVAMGTNDFLNANPIPVEEQSFVAGYQQLLEKIRSMNPDAEIICLEPLPGCLGPKPGQLIEKAVYHLQEKGMSKLHYIPVNHDKPLLGSGDYVGDQVHPNPQGSRKLARFLKPKLARILQW